MVVSNSNIIKKYLPFCNGWWRGKIAFMHMIQTRISGIVWIMCVNGAPRLPTPRISPGRVVTLPGDLNLNPGIAWDSRPTTMTSWWWGVADGNRIKRPHITFNPFIALMLINSTNTVHFSKCLFLTNTSIALIFRSISIASKMDWSGYGKQWSKILIRKTIH